MFTGAVTVAVVQQILRGVDFASWGEVFVGGSGSFRLEQAVKSAFPNVPVHGNDVSLFSCSVGALATGETFPIRFTNRLGFIETLIEGQPFAVRVAAVQVALEMTKYFGENPYAMTHLAYYTQRFTEFLNSTAARLAEFVDRTRPGKLHGRGLPGSREPGGRVGRGDSGVPAVRPGRLRANLQAARRKYRMAKAGVPDLGSG